MIYNCIEFNLKGRNESSPAKLTTYILENTPQIDENRKRPAVVICPGGGYMFTSDREAEPIALQMVAAGFHAFVLRYNVAPYEYPTALLELAYSIKLIRENAAKWNIDTDRIIVAGFSAGGHLACSFSEFWKEDFISEELNVTSDILKPNGCILAYPVITSGEFAHRGSFVNLLGNRYNDLLDKMSLEKNVSEDMPPVFLWHTFKDDAVPVENSLLLIQSLRKHNISTEFHMYPDGGHGLSLASEETNPVNGGCSQPECEGWIRLAIDWIKRL